MQLATRNEARIVDPLARDADLAPLHDLIADPAVEVVLHSGGQDLEILFRLARRLPRSVFDTQIAAALLNMGDQVGYGALVNGVLGVKLEKLETRTDWTRRPLTPAQTAYALDDVRYLLPLRDELRLRLQAKGRLSWLVEESAFYERIETYEPDTREAWRRVSRVRSLERRGLAILRELAAWREDTARKADEPRGRLASDEVLVEIARRAPVHARELSAIRGLHPGVIDRFGASMVAAVAAGAATPPEEWPESSPGPGGDPEGSALLDLLEIVLRLRAMEAQIAPSYLGARRDLVDLVEFERGQSAAGEKPSLLRGWRHELAGAALLSTLAGGTALRIDPETGRVVATSLS